MSLTMSLPPDDPRHGMNGYTNLDCRCSTCRHAGSAYHRSRYKKVNIGGASVDFPLPDYEALLEYAHHRGESMRQIALRAVAEYMERNP